MSDKTTSKSKVLSVAAEEPEVDGDLDTDGELDTAVPLDGTLLPADVSSDADALLPAVASTLRPTQIDFLKTYLAEISKYPLLTPDQEFDLALRLAETGDVEAARSLVTANLRLVVKIAMEYRNAYQNVMDLIQEGNVGLMKAVSKFDPHKGAKLSYYASWWIRSYILKYILDNFRLVKVGTTQAQKKLFFHLVREREKLEAQGIEAGPKLLADRLDVREKDIVEMNQRLSGAGAEMSLNAPMSGEDSDVGRTHLEFLRDQKELADEALQNEELREIVAEHINEFKKSLKEKELAIFEHRIAAEEPKTLQEVADLFGLTRERARQIESRVIEKLREHYQEYLR
jgi:RNA polymerase sigma-32 factor